MRGLFYAADQNVYLFLPINGSGLGHLTRTLAVARRLRQLQPDCKIVFLTTSIGVPLVHQAGFVCHHVTPAALAGEGVGSVAWNRLFYKTLLNVLQLYKPGTLLFDGSEPYYGIQRIMFGYRNIKSVWIKRGMYKSNVDQNRLNGLIDAFDLVISPGEVLDKTWAEETGSPKVRYVPPICLLDKSDLLKASAVKEIFRLDAERPSCYVQLGSRNINGMDNLEHQVTKILGDRGVQVVLGRSPITLNADSQENFVERVLVDYPNGRYFAGFDFAVLAAGYNSVCEALLLGLPAIFIPNLMMGVDDQLARVSKIHSIGPYVAIGEFSATAMKEAVDSMLDRLKNEAVAVSEHRNGAEEAARLLMGLVSPQHGFL